MRFRHSLVAFAWFISAALISAATLSAQDVESRRETVSVEMPPADESVFRIAVTAPTTTRLGDSFEYSIRVANISDNIALRDIIVAQVAQPGFQIESSQGSDNVSRLQPRGRNGQPSRTRSQPQQSQNSQSQPGPDVASGQHSNQQPGSRRQQETQSGTASQETRGQNAVREQRMAPGDDQQNNADRRSAQQQQNQQNQSKTGEPATNQGRTRSAQQAQSQFAAQWRIKELNPGQDATIRVTAANDSDGGRPICIAIVRFTPQVCIPLTVVKSPAGVRKDRSRGRQSL